MSTHIGTHMLARETPQGRHLPSLCLAKGLPGWIPSMSACGQEALMDTLYRCPRQSSRMTNADPLWGTPDLSGLVIVSSSTHGLCVPVLCFHRGRATVFTMQTPQEALGQIARKGPAHSEPAECHFWIGTAVAIDTVSTRDWHQTHFTDRDTEAVQTGLSQDAAPTFFIQDHHHHSPTILPRNPREILSASHTHPPAISL